MVIFNSETAWLSSPMNHVMKIAKRAKTMKAIIVYAEHDPPQFQLQSKLFAKVSQVHQCWFLLKRLGLQEIPFQFNDRYHIYQKEMISVE